MKIISTEKDGGNIPESGMRKDPQLKKKLLKGFPYKYSIVKEKNVCDEGRS